jgi:hypothetical protein
MCTKAAIEYRCGHKHFKHEANKVKCSTKGCKKLESTPVEKDLTKDCTKCRDAAGTLK